MLLNLLTFPCPPEQAVLFDGSIVSVAICFAKCLDAVSTDPFRTGAKTHIPVLPHTESLGEYWTRYARSACIRVVPRTYTPSADTTRNCQETHHQHVPTNIHTPPSGIQGPSTSILKGP